METAIYKYEFGPMDGAFAWGTQIPAGAKVLDIQFQQSTGKLVAWAEVPLTPSAQEVLSVLLLHTGVSLYNFPNRGEYVKTIQDGHLVWHIYKSANPEGL